MQHPVNISMQIASISLLRSQMSELGFLYDTHIALLMFSPTGEVINYSSQERLIKFLEWFSFLCLNVICSIYDTKCDVISFDCSIWGYHDQWNGMIISICQIHELDFANFIQVTNTNVFFVEDLLQIQMKRY